MTVLEDAQIVQLYWDRDERAIPATAEKYGSYCAAIAKRIVGNDADAEECVNDALLGAWNAIPPGRPAVLSAFLGKLTRNVSFNRYRRNTAAKRGGGEQAAVLDELAECVSGRESAERETDRKELAAAINGFLASLPRKKRDIFLRRYWYSDSVSEIARRHGMKDGAVSAALSRLRGALRSYLTERGYDI